MIRFGLNGEIKAYIKRALLIFMFAAVGALVSGGAVFAYRYSIKNYEAPITSFDTVSLFESQTKEKLKAVRLIADGGLASQSPRDSSASFLAAAESGYDAVLIFVRETADGELVVSKESRVDKMTDMKGEIKKLRYDNLLKAKIDNGANAEQFEGLGLLTFEEAMKICKKYRISPIIEAETLSEKALENLLNRVKENGLNERAVLSLHDGALLKKLAQKKNMPELCYAVEELSADFSFFLKDNSIKSVMFNADNYNGELIKSYCKEGYKLYCRDVNDTELIKRLCRLGVTDFITQRIVY